jgi:anti-sigma B factor antagonist
VEDEMDELVDSSGPLARCETLADRSGTPTLKLIGELDIGSVAPIRKAIDAVVANRPTRVILDLSELRFMDSSGLSVLLATADRVGEVELRQPSAMVRKIIDVTGVSGVFIMTP